MLAVAVTWAFSQGRLLPNSALSQLPGCRTGENQVHDLQERWLVYWRPVRRRGPTGAPQPGGVGSRACNFSRRWYQSTASGAVRHRKEGAALEKLAV